MRLDQLIKIKTKERKRVGRGVGSGRGKTAGRGTKGQKAKGRIPAGFAGGTLPLYRKLPLRRGLGNPAIYPKPTVLNLSRLSIFRPKTVVDLEKLIEAKIIKEKDLKKGVKILGGGKLEYPLFVKLPTSYLAKQKIEKAGGQVV